MPQYTSMNDALCCYKDSLSYKSHPNQVLQAEGNLFVWYKSLSIYVLSRENETHTHKKQRHIWHEQSNQLLIFSPVSSNITTLRFLFQTRSCTACVEPCSVQLCLHQVTPPAYRDSLHGWCSRDGVKLLPLPVLSYWTSDDDNKKNSLF